MAGAGAELPGVLIRQYQRVDRPQVEAFRCAHYGDKWCVAAEKIIQEAPGAIAPGGYFAGIAVAAEGRNVVGVVVFGFQPDRRSVSELIIFSLGVTIDRQRQDIGTRSKRAVMAAAADEANAVAAVVSTVHRANYRMIGLNKKLNVGTVKDPDDGEYLLTAVTVEPDRS